MRTLCLFLMSIVNFRFWQFKNGHGNPSCGIIVFGMRDLKVMTYEMFENKVESIPPSAM
jgi:hypothetical protein